MTWLSAITALDPSALLILGGIVFVASVVRGFSGFALSGVAIALGVAYLPPAQLIPILLVLEIVASLFLIRRALPDTDWVATRLLIVGTLLGTPIGLVLTLSLPVETSRLLALMLVGAMALTQLVNLRIPALATTVGMILAGILAGLLTGLASIGPMAVAVAMLARGASAPVSRAVIVVYTFIVSLPNLGFMLWLDVMTVEAATRGLVYTIPCAVGVLVGQWLFSPRFQPYYRPVCLGLLLSLTVYGLVRQVFGL